MNNNSPARHGEPWIRLLAVVALWLVVFDALAQTAAEKAALGVIEALLLRGDGQVVILTAPAPGAVIGVNVNTALSATATGDTITKVEFLVNGALIGTDTTAPYSINWTPTLPGSYSLTARATNPEGDTKDSVPVNVTVVVNEAPSVNLTAPANNSSYAAPGSVSLAATALDKDGTIAKVEFYRGTTLVATRTSAPYIALDANVPGGTYGYTAKAYDNLNAVSTSKEVLVNVIAITFTSPGPGQNFAVAPASITLTASVTPGSAIQRVVFFQGNTPLNTDTTAPYEFIWSNVPAGSYTLTARASDAQNFTVSSTEITVTVGAVSQQTQMYFIYPDHLNTPRVITDAKQQVVWRWDNTDPFGNNEPNENPSGLGNFTCNLRLPGQYFDKETKLHYNYFRDYDPAIGRYVQSDPIGLKGGINTYAYVGGNPISFVDPKGLQQCGPGFRAVPMPGNEKNFPQVALCKPEPGSDPNEKRCVTAECAGGVLPNPRPPPPACCDWDAVSNCLITTIATGGADCAQCALSKGKNRQACIACGAGVGEGVSCFVGNCGPDKCSTNLACLDLR